MYSFRNKKTIQTNIDSSKRNKKWSKNNTQSVYKILKLDKMFKNLILK